ncbi:arylsulfatase B-like [Liolophura sinensis]|uniref:arylsulfatase B-like n=1 Tax=Liolophura sinensis TaxID=3198878 RepID=UPI0031595DBF
MMTWKTTLSAVAAVFLCALGEFTVQSQSNKQPHILFIVADDYGFHDIGYHNSEIKTPNLDKLAGDGVKLENYYVQPICTPTRSQLFSGKYQIHTGLQHSLIWSTQPNGLPLEDPTLADKMKEAGYSTHMVGKWHIGFYKEEYLPTRRGFDSYFGYYGGGEDYYGHNTCSYLLKGFCGYDFRDGDKVDYQDKGNYSTHVFTQRAIDVVNSHDPNQPLFLYIAFQAVHAPLEVPEKYTQMYDFIQDKNRRTYAGMVTCMDEAVGNITKAFQDKFMFEDTFMIFTTDNGGQIHEGGNNWPLRGWKGSLWDGGMKGVGFVHGNGLTKPGTINTGLMHVTDWYPTLVNLAKGSLNGTKLDGHDQWETISQGKPSSRQEILHNIDPLSKKTGQPLRNASFDNTVRAALRVGDWKIITGGPGNSSWIPPPHMAGKTQISSEAPTKNLWLFNIAVDPEERDDISEQYPDMVRKMLERLQAYNVTAVPVRYPKPDPRSNPKLHGGAWGPWET